MALIFLIFLLGAIIMSVITAWCHHKRGNGISIIIPLRCDDKNSRRYKNFEWNMRYWKAQLPGAELIVGEDKDLDLIFSKAAAVNEGVSRATGDVLVIVDADGYVESSAVLTCARRIRNARRRGHRLWFIPYRRFYRLTDLASQRVLDSESLNPWHFSVPPDPNDIQNVSGSHHGHWFGAMIQIWPREAFDEVGGWDERFRGWGGEDHSAMRACDTLYWPHKTLPGQVLHLWHPMLSSTGTDSWVHWNRRIWDKQTDSGANDELNSRYYGANGDRVRMRKLVDEGRKK